jgi:hypothetical protein
MAAGGRRVVGATSGSRRAWVQAPRRSARPSIPPLSSNRPPSDTTSSRSQSPTLICHACSQPSTLRSGHPQGHNLPPGLVRAWYWLGTGVA